MIFSHIVIQLTRIGMIIGFPKYRKFSLLTKKAYLIKISNENKFLLNISRFGHGWNDGKNHFKLQINFGTSR